MKRFGKFILLDCLGRGGVADIYRAKQFGQGRCLALKCIHPSYVEEPELISMFIDEARMLAILRHPNIVEVVDLGMIDGCYFMAMEYIDGHPLIGLQQHALRMPEDRLPPHCSLYIAREVARGLSFAHEYKDASGKALCIVHRDISPQNVMVSVEGQVKIIDFGVAKISDRLGKSRHGTLKGTCAYMSPEQARGDRVDHRSDIFALGVVLHELLCGERLFAGDNEMAILDRVQRCEMRLATRDSHGLPPQVEQLLRRALAPVPADRFPSALAMAQALEEALQLSCPEDPQERLSMIARRARREQKASGERKIAFDQGGGNGRSKSPDPLLDYFSQQGDVTLGQIRELLEAVPAGVLHRETIDIEREEDIVLARRVGMQIAKNLAMRGKDVTSVGTVISELTRNVVRYAERGKICLEVLGDPFPGLRIMISDQGPGIELPDPHHEGPISSKHGMGMGIIASRRLMDEFAIETSREKGTVITAVKYK